MKKIYLDCGAYNGTSLKLFVNSYNMKLIPGEWDIYCFEPDVTCNLWLEDYKKANPSLNCTIINKAVWDRDGEIPYYNYEGPGNPQKNGSTVMKWKNEVDIKYENVPSNTKIVECISLSKFIKTNFDKDDFIVVKFNIEGAEYTILNDLIDTDALSYINDLEIDFHYFNNRYPNEKLKELPGWEQMEQEYNVLRNKYLEYIKTHDLTLNRLGFYLYPEML